MLAAMGLVGDEADQFLTSADQFGEVRGALGGNRVGSRLQLRAVVPQDGGVDRIGFGESTPGAGKVADLPGIDHTD